MVLKIEASTGREAGSRWHLRLLRRPDKRVRGCGFSGARKGQEGRGCISAGEGGMLGKQSHSEGGRGCPSGQRPCWSPFCPLTFPPSPLPPPHKLPSLSGPPFLPTQIWSHRPHGLWLPLEPPACPITLPSFSLPSPLCFSPPQHLCFYPLSRPCPLCSKPSIQSTLGSNGKLPGDPWCLPRHHSPGEATFRAASRCLTVTPHP